MYENDLYNNISSSAVSNQGLHSLSLEKGLILRHALNFLRLIIYCSSLHDAVRDTLFIMAPTASISCTKEPLLKETLSLNIFGSDDRGDVYCDQIENSEADVDFVSCNFANDTLVQERRLSSVVALEFKAKENKENMTKILKNLMVIEIHS
ncbi:hypothetical protein P9112_000442 [Eukaryota sp. TZLM1-RC]